MGKKVKIAYIGGGSRNWARVFMNDLTLDDGLYGEIALYDIDMNAALRNKKIGERLSALPEARSNWEYSASPNLSEALTGSDFVIISILPGTFEHMRSDVHAPEKYGVYQSVGDTAGPGGVLRSMRTAPVFEDFARAIREYCPDAWIINFTNPMSICLKALYSAYPEIKAFGCCHEVFNAQNFLSEVYNEVTGNKTGNEKPDRHDIITDVTGINHFTFITKAHYGEVDLLSLLPGFMEKYPDGFYINHTKNHKQVDFFACKNLVKLDLFKRYGSLGAAGDRHLAEFCDGNWYLKSHEAADSYGFKLTPVSYRIERGDEQTKEAEELANGAPISLNRSGEEAVDLIKAVSGLGKLVSNVNMPNMGQISFLPEGAIVETNCIFSTDSVRPTTAANPSVALSGLISRACYNVEALWDGIKNRDLKALFAAFCQEPLCSCLNLDDARTLFTDMVKNTAECLEPYYDLTKLKDI